MSVIKNGKKYYTRNELDNRLNNYIEKSANDLISELKKKNKKINTKEVSYV